MPTEYWYPITDVVHDLPAGMDDWTAAGSGSVNENANTRVGGGRAGPATHDDDVSYISRTWSAGTEEQALNIDWPGPMTELAFGTFTANGRHRVANATHRYVRFTNAAGAEPTVWLDVNDSGAAYVSTGPVDVSTAATYRPGGGSWATTDFADDKTTFVNCQITSGQAVFTSIWGQIQFNTAGGLVPFFLGLVGTSALPFVGRFVDFQQFGTYLNWRRVSHRRHTILRPGEDMQLWRDLREYRWPVRFIMAM